MKRTRLAALACVGLLVAPGCGTLFFHNPQKIRVTSNVPGSLVIAKNEGILGKMEGLSGEFPLDRSKDHTLLVSAHGNEAATVVVVSHWSWWRILISLGGDIFLGCIPAPPILWGVLAIIPDVGSGSWKVLDDNVSVSLRARSDAEPSEYDALPSVEQPSSAPRNATAPAAVARACPSCGAGCASDAAFCPHCGVRLTAEAALKPCPICGEPRAPNSETCPHCGLK